ncbi:DUF1329 domain-containing protein [Methyloversatilis sp.]|uniref:DUF1329 domain-containing protein n=1 Tax=Methyloversatilis sp. TaxID=2569862 RepID=UPI0035AF94ED
MKLMNALSAALLSLATASGALAAVTAEEAARLKTDLTPLGAERAGNKDGSIPAWSGGYNKVPAGYKQGTPRIDPFADEKPLFTITAANMAQYADKLDEGQLHLLKKYPEYRLNVYKTHRTASAPEWMYEETFKNATRTKLEGYAIKNAFGGVPFPIPKSGAEVVWNHNLRIHPAGIVWPMHSYVIDASGTSALATGAVNEIRMPYFDKSESLESVAKGYYFGVLQSVSAPSVRAGELLMFRDSLDNTRASWQYLVGQRRVRRAPNLCCDTPNFVNSGVDFFDQPFIFFGPMDRYEWKIVGKKEMFIPYNNNRLLLTPHKDLIGKNFTNPEAVRWELHRVWEIEGTVREGQRDVRARRKLYADEDSWTMVIGNTWDAQGRLWHTSVGYPTLMPEMPTINLRQWVTMDFIKGSYTITLNTDEKSPIQIAEPPPSANLLTPEGMVVRGVR